MVNSNVSLDVSKNGTQATVYVNQHEVETRSLVISLNNDGKKLFLPENYYVTAQAVIDGKTYSNEAKIENDKIFFTFPSSYFDKSGKFELQVRIQKVSGEKSYVLYSPKIQVVVSKSIYDSDAVTGTTEYDRFAYDIQRMLTSQIDSIEETVEDKKHTYTVKFKAGNSQTFIIYDGKDGKDGKNGVDAVEGIKKIIYNGSELAVSDDKTVEFNAQPYIEELDFINDESEIEKLAIGKLYIVTKEMNIDRLTYYPGSLIMKTTHGIAGFGDFGFILNGDFTPVWNEIQDGITFKKTESGYVVSVDGKETELILPTKTSDLENDSNFVSDANYIHTDNNFTNEEKTKLENDVATKDYVEQEIATFDFIKIVEALPEQGLPNRTYFVPKTDQQTNDLYDEYMWVNNKWEFVGTRQIEVDLTNYVKNTDFATDTKAGIVKANVNGGLHINPSTGDMQVAGASLPAYKFGTSNSIPVTAISQHIATFYGLAKASGDTTQSKSSNAVGKYTDEAKTKIQNMLGVQPKFELGNGLQLVDGILSVSYPDGDNIKYGTEVINNE